MIDLARALRRQRCRLPSCSSIRPAASGPELAAAARSSARLTDDLDGACARQRRPVVMTSIPSAPRCRCCRGGTRERAPTVVEARVVDLVEEVLQRPTCSRGWRACRGVPVGFEHVDRRSPRVRLRHDLDPVIERSVAPSSTASNIECNDGDVVCARSEPRMRPTDYEQRRRDGGPHRVTLVRQTCSTGLDDHSVVTRQPMRSLASLVHRRARSSRFRHGSQGGSHAAAGIGTARRRQLAVRPDDRRSRSRVSGVGVREAVEGRRRQRRDLPGRHQDTVKVVVYVHRSTSEEPAAGGQPR